MSTETLTVVFTDLVGSTEQRVRVGVERAEELRREHFTILRDGVSASGGREVKSVGDGVMAVFPAPTAALDAMIQVQRSAEYRNRSADEPFHIRVGMSLGEVDQAEGDCFGICVVEAARLCDLASGGQILATEMVRAVTGARGDHRFNPLGVRELKGFTAATPVWEITWTPVATDELGGVPLPARVEPRVGLPFVGRGVEQAVLTEAFKATAGGTGRHVVLAGEAGVGKTTLLGAFAAAAHRQGATVLFGRCDEDLSIPYHPWREALRHLAEHRPEVVDEHRDALAVLLRSDPPEPASMDPEGARYVLYRAVVATLAAAAAEAPVMVVLDDLHWADQPTIALARHIAQSSTARVMMVGTYREAELDVDHALIAVLATLHREPLVQRLHLHGLSDGELLELMEAMAGHELGPDGVGLRDALLAETDGNPFFATEILRHLAETGAIFQAADGRWGTSDDLRVQGLPVSVREVIGLRVGRLGRSTRRALLHASVLGRDFDLHVLAELLGEDVGDTFASLVPAVEARVVVDVAPEHFTFSHALIGHALYDELTPTARAHAHHRVGQILEAALDRGDGPGAGELAHHWALAGPHGAAKAARFARQAGDDSLSQLAPDEAARWYQRALDLSTASDDCNRCELLIWLGEAQRQAGAPEFRQTLLDACRLARSIDRSDLLVRAALANNRGSISEYGAVDVERVAMLRAAIEVQADGEEGALLHATLAAEVYAQDLAEARRLAETAIALARTSASDRGLAKVAIVVSPVMHCPANLTMLRQLHDEAEAAAARTGDPSTLGELAGPRHSVAIESADLDEADHYLALYARIADQVPEPYFRWLGRLTRASRLFIAGRLQEADDLAAEALEVGTAAAQPNAFGFYAAQLFEIRRAQGRLGEIIDLLEEVVADTPGIPGYRAGLAVARCDVGRFADARELLQPSIDAGFENIPFDLVWSTSMMLVAEAAAQVAPDEMAPLVPLLEPWRAQFAYSNIVAEGSLARGLGLALAACGRTEEAVRAFGQALEVNERLGAPILVAQTQVDLARTIGAADRDAARDLACTAAITAARLGLGTISRRSAELLTELG